MVVKAFSTSPDEAASLAWVERDVQKAQEETFFFFLVPSHAVGQGQNAWMNTIHNKAGIC